MEIFLSTINNVMVSITGICLYKKFRKCEPRTSLIIEHLANIALLLLDNAEYLLICLSIFTQKTFCF